MNIWIAYADDTQVYEMRIVGFETTVAFFVTVTDLIAMLTVLKRTNKLHVHFEKSINKFTENLILQHLL